MSSVQRLTISKLRGFSIASKDEMQKILWRLQNEQQNTRKNEGSSSFRQR